MPLVFMKHKKMIRQCSTSEGGLSEGGGLDSRPGCGKYFEMYFICLYNFLGGKDG